MMLSESVARSAVRRWNIHSALALAGIAGPIVLVIADFTAAFISPSYSMLHDSISRLALTRLGWLQTIGFLALGLLVEVFVAGLLFNIRGVRGFHLGIGILLFFGFGLLLIGAFRTDLVGAPRTMEGMIHSLAATSVFWLFPIAVFIMAPSLKKDPRWKGIYVYTLVAGVLGLALVIGIMWLSDKLSWFGLYERILVANMVVWVEVSAIKLLGLSLGRERQADRAA